MMHKIPDTLKSEVSQDLFTYGSETFLVTVDYYSDYFEIDLLQDATTESVIKTIKSHFAQHGIADMITDNGPNIQVISSLLSIQFTGISAHYQFTTPQLE